MPAIAIGAMAGASLLSAKMQSNAAKNAANTQSASADKALDFSKGVYHDTQRNLNPYMQAGNVSLGNLMRQQSVPFNQQVASQLAPFQGGIGVPTMPQTPAMDVPNTGAGFGGAMGGGVPLNAIGAGPAMGGGPMVTLRAPTGEIRQVPAPMADQLIARGATRIG